MNCRVFEEQLNDLLDGTLPSSLLEAAEAHMDGCARWHDVEVEMNQRPLLRPTHQTSIEITPIAIVDWRPRPDVCILNLTQRAPLYG